MNEFQLSSPIWASLNCRKNEIIHKDKNCIRVDDIKIHFYNLS